MRIFSPSLSRILPIIVMLIAAPWAEASAQNTLSGTYTVDGKAATLNQVAAYKGDSESGKPITILVFTTKDQGNDPKAAFNALFNKYGDAIVVKLFDDGKVYSADLLHAKFDLPNNTVTAFSGVTIKDFKKADGQISGELTSTGEARGQKWDVDLMFKTKAP